jgi:error-prone DNA polymerase
MGFMSIRNLQENTVKEILDERKAGPFSSLDDFFLRVDPNLSDAMVLTNAGCFAALAPELSHREIAYRTAWHCLGEKTNTDVTLSLTMGEWTSNTMLRQAQHDCLSQEDRRRLDIESFGFPISEHPLDPYLSIIGGRVRKAKDLPKYIGRTIHLAGVYITRKETITVKNRDPMEFLTLEDETDIYECVLFPEAFRKYGDLLLWENLFILRGKVEESFGVISVTIEKLGSLSAMIKKMESV